MTPPQSARPRLPLIGPLYDLIARSFGPRLVAWVLVVLAAVLAIVWLGAAGLTLLALLTVPVIFYILLFVSLP